MSSREASKEITKIDVNRLQIAKNYSPDHSPYAVPCSRGTKADTISCLSPSLFAYKNSCRGLAL